MPTDFDAGGFLGDVLTAGARNIKSKADQSAQINNSPVVPSAQAANAMPKWLWPAVAGGVALVAFMMLRKR